MNSLSSYNKITKKNGRILPVFERIFQQSNIIPFYKTTIPWMIEEQKFTYEADSFAYKHRAEILQQEMWTTPELYFENKLYESVVWALLRGYLLRNNPKAVFYHTSQYDDYLASCDFIVSESGRLEDMIRIDLTIGDGKIRSFEENHTQKVIEKKIQRFHKISGIPEEFFQSVQPNTTPRPLPLIILRINRSLLVWFAHDYFEMISREKKTPDILAYFSHWMYQNSFFIQDRIAYILGMDKDSENTHEKNKQITHLATLVWSLFAWVDNVSMHYTDWGKH